MHGPGMGDGNGIIGDGRWVIGAPCGLQAAGCGLQQAVAGGYWVLVLGTGTGCWQHWLGTGYWAGGGGGWRWRGGEGGLGLGMYHVKWVLGGRRCTVHRRKDLTP
jgi:hypothetical protein